MTWFCPTSRSGFTCSFSFQPLCKYMWGWIPLDGLTPLHFCVCLKSGFWFSTSYVVVFDYAPWVEVRGVFRFVDIGGIVHHDYVPWVEVRGVFRFVDIGGIVHHVYVLWVEVRGVCWSEKCVSFCWYWWHCSPSLCKHSFHKTSIFCMPLLK